MAKGQPITWRNVAIKDGSGAAALGSVANQFGRTAQQGFSILSDQMQDNIDQEDERLTNEAISTALNGGPQVSGNRRVNAGLLQDAVSKQLRDNEFQETSDLQQTGFGLDNEKSQFAVDNQQQVFDSEQALRGAQRLAAENRSKESEYNLKLAQKDFNDRVRIEGSANDLNNHFYGGGWDQELNTQYDNLDHTGLSPEQIEQGRGHYVNAAKDRAFTDPDMLPKMAYSKGMSVREFTANTDLGKQWSEARSAAIAEDVAAAKRNAATTQVAIDSATNWTKGNKAAVQYNPNSTTKFSFGKSQGTINKAEGAEYMERLGLDSESDKAEKLHQMISTEFGDRTAYEHVLKSVIGDSGRIPDLAEARNVVEAMADDVARQAAAELNPQTFVAGGTPEQQFENWRQSQLEPDPVEEETPKVPKATQKVAAQVEDLGLDFNIHPERDLKTATADVKDLLVEIESGKRDGSGLPLSTNQIADRERQLGILLKRLETAPLGPLPSGTDISIQPK